MVTDSMSRHHRCLVWKHLHSPLANPRMNEVADCLKTINPPLPHRTAVSVVQRILGVIELSFWVDLLNRACVSAPKLQEQFDGFGSSRILEVVQIASSPVAASTIRGMPGANVKCNHISRLRVYRLTRDFLKRCILYPFYKRLTFCIPQQMRSRNDSLCAGVCCDRIKVEDVLDSDL